MCLRENFERRLAQCPDHFLLLRRTDSGEICAFLSDIRSDAPHLTDDMFSGAVRHVPAGDGMMLLGLNVRPAYRGRGLASCCCAGASAKRGAWAFRAWCSPATTTCCSITAPSAFCRRGRPCPVGRDAVV